MSLMTQIPWSLRQGIRHLRVTHWITGPMGSPLSWAAVSTPAPSPCVWDSPSPHSHILSSAQPSPCLLCLALENFSYPTVVDQKSTTEAPGAATVFVKALHSGLADLPPFYRTWQHCPACPIRPDSGPLSKNVFLPSAREVLPEAKSWVPPPAHGVLVEAKSHSCHPDICHVEWFLLFLPLGHLLPCHWSPGTAAVCKPTEIQSLCRNPAVLQ